uniref:MADS-box domain-containing protein n=1 Tax=Ananas comosus var. bracteatus TaxID=296719 RepID=A0A6V7NLF3_ANACO|nr:unnamed protein product [Ananas comosus var. bracteatus]
MFTILIALRSGRLAILRIDVKLCNSRKSRNPNQLCSIEQWKAASGGRAIVTVGCPLAARIKALIPPLAANEATDQSMLGGWHGRARRRIVTRLSGTIVISHNVEGICFCTVIKIRGVRRRACDAEVALIVFSTREKLYEYATHSCFLLFNVLLVFISDGVVK